ncbi:hypothetical protein SMACR_06490 [Sordaria macrospora]|uniref:WGS project CABT00000000 data, contig 2.13 n=2 Tax=Sordaria macrospora TaxID=5147 RepID=F7VYH2_SORMK|nr:uncharacterized protein SMAC_06490 [Sordaria macrospora k-hell]KAA8629295.1 hypothetical protein SMACR_06490 [Sordaria macrospora]KAH7631698.1 hypothetical protein B0T09DRAFT_260595 [Sordaria sp. MPI-SDFR-AT-0083]WPJ63007.1 hypothetical protein SMAC4_06490 [Sordaria macrospora]CCC10567.1 unnamed protein product [Sordaria macrospora k-hell]
MSFDGFNSPPRSPKRRRILASYNPVPFAAPVAPATKSDASEALGGSNARAVGGGGDGGSRSKHRHRSREPELDRGRSRSTSLVAEASKGSSRTDRGVSHDRGISRTGVGEDVVGGDQDGEGERERERKRDRDRDRYDDGDQDQDRDSEGRRKREKKPKVTKFRFKDKDRESRRRRRRSRSRSQSLTGSRSRSPRPDRHRSRRHRSEEDNEPKDGEPRRKHRHRHHHRRHRRHRSPTPTPAPQQQQQPDPEEEDPFAEPPLDPEAAFRESLFDAMADDEGAAYWEGVYGQPIHVYSSARERVNPEGELERMTDEEYAAYVRQRMWEKTHQGLLEERERRQKRKEEERRREEEERRIAKEMERSLKRGEERRKRRVWKDRWEEYLKAWQELAVAAAATEGGKKFDANKIPWPVNREVAVGGKIEEMDPETVRAFFVHGIGLEELGEKEFAARLKDERVRWHPDKMQQRLGGDADAMIMRDVTAIFQIVDKLWNDTRKSS